MKTYVITLSEKSPTTHPRKGQETEFGRLFLNGKKIHTIRGNFPLWEKRLKEVQEGRAVLSVRQWTGVPYRSPQKELRRLTAEDGVGVQNLSFSHEIIGFEIDKRGYRVRLDNLSDVVQNPERNLHKGQIVSFTNKYGVTFKNLEILGFCEPWDGRCVYLDKSSYWFPTRPEELTVQENGKEVKE